MLAEVLRFLRPAPGEVALDCTLGGGGHAEGILRCLQPGGRLVGLDVDPLELARTTVRLREAWPADSLIPIRANFAAARELLSAAGIETVDLVLADLGVSSMQADQPARGFHYKVPGPLDMRMNTESGETAADLIQRLTADELSALLQSHADEPHASTIAALLKRERITTTQALERTVRLGLAALVPGLAKPQVKMSIRRTFQALRIAVNDEFRALDALLADLPAILAPGGRVVVLTFHSGEDRRVKHAFRAGLQAGVYADIARTVTKSATLETRANRRASSAKLRWAVRARG
jgi:16S rRNA (cytosine1402-N4)-methyltransferase